MHEFKNSKMLSHCQHEGDCLTITFAKGQKYKYYGVPKEEYENLIKAESGGGHFSSHIRGKYKHEKVEE